MRGKREGGQSNGQTPRTTCDLRSNAGCSSDQADCIAIVGALPAPSLWQRGTLMIEYFDDWALRPGAGLFSSAYCTTGGRSGTE